MSPNVAIRMLFWRVKQIHKVGLFLDFIFLSFLFFHFPTSSLGLNCHYDFATREVSRFCQRYIDGIECKYSERERKVSCRRVSDKHKYIVNKLTSSRVWMRSSWVFRTSGCQWKSRNLESIPASFDTVESEGQQMKQCWKMYKKKQKKIDHKVNRGNSPR